MVPIAYERLIILRLYSVYDKVAQTFSAPQQDINDATAIRNFTNGINRPNDCGEHNMLYKYPDDYELYYLGDIDDSTGHFSVPDNGVYPRFLIRASDCIDISQNSGDTK